MWNQKNTYNNKNELRKNISVTDSFMLQWSLVKPLGWIFMTDKSGRVVDYLVSR